MIDEFIRTELESQHEILEAANGRTEKDWEPLNKVFRRLVYGVSSDDIAEAKAAIVR